MIVPDQSSSIVKTAKIYDTCLDTAAIERRGISPLENLIKQYGGWSVTGGGTNSSWTVAKKMGAVLRDLNVQTLFSVSVGIDLKDSSRHILNVSATLMYCIKQDRLFPNSEKSVENTTNDEMFRVFYVYLQSSRCRLSRTACVYQRETGGRGDKDRDRTEWKYRNHIRVQCDIMQLEIINK